MVTLNKARSYLLRHPGEAMADALGLTVIASMILLGFTLPALL